MNTNLLRIAAAVLFFTAIFVSGFWLSRSGKPYNGIIFNTHKIIALAAVTLFVIALYRAHRTAALGAAELSAGVVTGLLFVGLFVAGGSLSMARPMPAIVLRVHQVTPYLAVFSTAVTLYFLRTRQ